MKIKFISKIQDYDSTIDKPIILGSACMMRGGPPTTAIFEKERVYEIKIEKHVLHPKKLIVSLALSVSINRILDAVPCDFDDKNVITQESDRVLLAFGDKSKCDIRRTIQNFHSRLKEGELKKLDEKLFVSSFYGKNASFINKDGSETSFYNDFLEELKDLGPWSLICLDTINRFFPHYTLSDKELPISFIVLLERLSLDVPGNPTIIFNR